jgi:hypothetical protein
MTGGQAGSLRLGKLWCLKLCSRRPVQLGTRATDSRQRGANCGKIAVSVTQMGGRSPDSECETQNFSCLARILRPVKIDRHGQISASRLLALQLRPRWQQIATAGCRLWLWQHAHTAYRPAATRPRGPLRSHRSRAPRDQAHTGFPAPGPPVWRTADSSFYTARCSTTTTFLRTGPLMWKPSQSQS